MPAYRKDFTKSRMRLVCSVRAVRDGKLRRTEARMGNNICGTGSISAGSAYIQNTDSSGSGINLVNQAVAMILGAAFRSLHRGPIALTGSSKQS